MKINLELSLTEVHDLHAAVGCTVAQLTQVIEASATNERLPVGLSMLRQEAMRLRNLEAKLRTVADSTRAGKWGGVV